jgi:hydroxyacylglutathione hydrolase
VGEAVPAAREAAIVALDTPSLGNRSYLATDGAVALVVDAQRDIDRILALAAEHKVRITDVFETHIHNDYVTGGLALARTTGARYVVAAADRVGFDRVPAHDGDLFDVGPSLRVRVIATPGHTFSHLCYALESGAETIAVFTGGSLLNGSTGRTDLLGAEHREELARAQHASAHRLARELPETARLCPTHGFGSFCAASQSAARQSTIGAEKLANPALTLDVDSYVRTLLAGLDAYPAYYAHMAPLNRAGPAAPEPSPPRPADAEELRRRIDAGEWVADLRSRTVFAAGHLGGALNFELGDGFATYLGWLMPWGAPLTVIASAPGEVAAAQRELARIGIDAIAGAAAGPAAAWSGGEPLRAFPVASFSDWAERGGGPKTVLLDVRLASEFAQSHIGGAVHIPLHELRPRLAEVPPGEVWVHCKSGYRAAVAASLLEAAGRDVVLIDDEFASAERAGLARPGG